MEFPELLYVPQPSEVAKAVLQPRRLQWFQVNNTAALSLSTQTRAVPVDEVWKIHRYLVRCTPGAGQASTARRADVIQSPTGILIGTADEDRTVGAAATVVVRAENVDIWLMPGEVFQVFSTFDAAALANRMDSYAWGWSIPRASVQYETG